MVSNANSSLDSQVQDYCSQHPTIPFCSCITLASTASKSNNPSVRSFGAQPACIDGTCSTSGYKLAGYTTNCQNTVLNCNQTVVISSELGVKLNGLSIPQNCNIDATTGGNKLVQKTTDLSIPQSDNYYSIVAFIIFILCICISITIYFYSMYI